MWIAALAMQRFLQPKDDPDATIPKMHQTEVYDALGATQIASGTGDTPDDAPGLPIAGWGALPTAGILARAGALIAAGGKAPDGTQILSADLVASLSSGPDDGLTFWRKDAGGKIVPSMQGAGGNSVMALPDGMPLVTLSRENSNYSIPDQAIAAPIAAARDIRPF
jgi:hypothetical protein